ncbi:CPBP family intramembrane glutamic endopeptidase [Sphingomonas aerophila]|uniref:Membrane protease YdiL (CAAX protease family) n=1 Tax=Sphingomonas aerophila TaxID=1344948 RepID=A0A7W9ETJ9_9SPHN|nr:CPBP family intramembrane glutamic endopeptidase [Sphingomonas aerophila]MBB5714230.1 membrane protease YdiL (CAAX protease family) [Sphingomonas aerophila]
MPSLAVILAALLLALPWAMRRRWRWGPHPLARVAGRILVFFGLTAAAALLLAGRPEAAVRMPGEFAPAAVFAAVWTGIPFPVALPVSFLVLAMIGGGVVAGLIARVRRREPMTLGDVSGMVPRRVSDLGWGALVSVVAGVGEELYFRLALPLVLSLLGIGAIWAFVGSALLFGWAHRYQGVLGITATAVIALLLSATYLLTGQLWIATVLHVALDLNGLIVRPLVAGMIRR